MPIKIKFVPILPRRRALFDIPAGHAAAEQALISLGEDAVKEFEKVTNTWNEKPAFVVRLRNMSVDVSTNDKKFYYLDRGTSVRYAVMSEDFSPKTRVGVLGSSRGRGGMIFVSRRHPKPGIEARGWSVLVQEKIQAKFKTRFRDVIAAYKTGEAPGL